VGENSRVRIDIVTYDHPDAAALIDELQDEYVVRYGGRDATPVAPEQFAPPLGLFLVGYLEGVPVVCGGWRSHGDGVAELKRMYVTPSARGRGLARAMLAELESTAGAAGHHRIILESGQKQPEAIAMYASSGYTPVPSFGHYAENELSVHLGKTIGAGLEVR
jgi:GNAT superfamily N-acetyltransferase